MRRIDKAMCNAGASSKTNSYCGPLASTSDNGHNANVNNMSNSQVGGVLMMPYGISSVPIKGLRAQAIVNGDDDSTVVGVYDKDRPKVKSGEICIYSSGNASIHLTKDGIIDIKCKKFRVNGVDIS